MSVQIREEKRAWGLAALTTAGGDKWSPDGDMTVEHWGADADGVWGSTRPTGSGHVRSTDWDDLNL